jgi:IS5 family transposase
MEQMRKEDRDHLHPGDTQARMMKSGGKTEFGYNAQAVVDSDSGLIVAQDVVNEESDAHLLTRMLDETKETLGGTAEDTAADGGYVSGEQIAKAQKKGYEVLLPMSADKQVGEYHASKFEYDADRDVVTCPLGGKLTYERTKKSGWKKYDVRIYRCRGCRGCEARWECSLDKKGRQIEISEWHEAVRRQLLKQKDEEKRQKLKRRGAIVERVFGTIKEQMGFRRFSVNGLTKVRAQWSLICIAVNLRKMYGRWAAGKLSVA